MEYEFLKWIHIISATLLFGTGLGSAFYKYCADRSGNLHVIAHTNKIVVIADWLFTTPSVIIQPITGIMLVNVIGLPLTEPWIIAAFILYFIAGACWLPVVWLQIQMRNLSRRALIQHNALDETYMRYARMWFRLGIPAFISLLVVYYLMIYKPAFTLLTT